MKSSALLKVALWSVGLGLLMEALLLLLAAAAGKIPALAPIVSDTVQKVSWSAFVCAGLAVGQTAARNRAGLMGLAGLIAAPVSFYLAKSLHKGMNQALSVAGAGPGGPSPWALAGIKALEYAVLGVLIGRLSQRAAGARMYAVCGLLVGLVFGGFTTWAYFMPPGATLVSVLPKALNEILFPLGCAMVLFGAQKIDSARKPD